jgi:hypothetical protein
MIAPPYEVKYVAPLVEFQRIEGAREDGAVKRPFVNSLGNAMANEYAAGNSHRQWTRPEEVE